MVGKGSTPLLGILRVPSKLKDAIDEWAKDFSVGLAAFLLLCGLPAECSFVIFTSRDSLTMSGIVRTKG